ncbi:MAG: hypothetical protein ACYC0X_29120 [Pirellulaceae bacterium]
MVRYRCHTGHAYSAENLLDEEDQAAEDALYSAVRALQEKALLSRRMAQSFSLRLPDLEAQHLSRVSDLEEKVRILRQLITGQKT